MYKNKQIFNLLELRKKLKDAEFSIDFMPRYDLETRKVTGADALVKLETPKLGFHYKEFISLFEKLELSEYVDCYLLKKVCYCLKIWQQEGRNLIPITVYQSSFTFFNCDYTDALNKIINDYQVPAHLITLEFSIETIFHDISFSKNVLEKLKAIGFKIAILDSGIAEFYLNLLSELSFDELTFDVSSITNLSVEQRSQAILTKNIKISSQNECEVVYKGIESESNEKFLKTFGSKIGQGSYFSIPIPFIYFDEVVKEFGYYPSN